MRLSRRAQHSLNPWSHSRLIGRAFQNSGFDTCVGDSLFDVADEHFDHRFFAAQNRARSLKMKIKRQIVVGVNARSHDDVNRGLFRNSLDARNIPAKSDDSQINNGIHAASLQLVHPRDGIGDALFFVAPGFQKVLHDLRRKHKDVFVHQRHAKLRNVNSAAHGVDGCHLISPFVAVD